MGGELQNIKFQAPNWGPAQRVGTPKGKLQTNPKFQYLMTKTVLEFGILVIVIWNFSSLWQFNTTRQFSISSGACFAPSVAVFVSAAADYLSVLGSCSAFVLGIPVSVPGSCSDGVLGVAVSVPGSCSANALGVAVSVPGSCSDDVLGVAVSVPGSCSDDVLGIPVSVPESCSASGLEAAVCVLVAGFDICSAYVEVASAPLVGDF